MGRMDRVMFHNASASLDEGLAVCSFLFFFWCELMSFVAWRRHSIADSCLQETTLRFGVHFRVLAGVQAHRLGTSQGCESLGHCNMRVTCPR
jgi:hypothetical protein